MRNFATVFGQTKPVIGMVHLGAGTALLGEKAAHACTAAVETVIEEHYAAQIAEAICTRRAELMATAMAAPDAVKPAASPSGPAPSPLPPVSVSVQMAEASTGSPSAVHTSAPAPASDPAPVPGPVPEPVPAPVAASQPPTVPSTPPAASPPPPGGALVQYLSTPSEAELARARDKLRKHLGEDANQLTFSTAQAVVRGVTRYRGRIGPFPGSAEARTFCSTVRQRGFACLVLPHARNR